MVEWLQGRNLRCANEYDQTDFESVHNGNAIYISGNTTDLEKLIRREISLEEIRTYIMR